MTAAKAPESLVGMGSHKVTIIGSITQSVWCSEQRTGPLRHSSCAHSVTCWP